MPLRLASFLAAQNMYEIISGAKPCVVPMIDYVVIDIRFFLKSIQDYIEVLL